MSKMREYLLEPIVRFVTKKHVTLIAVLSASVVALVAARTLGSPASPKPIPEGWIIRGQPLSSANNQILPAGEILRLPERLTVKALNDCAIRIAPRDKSGIHYVHLLHGTALISRHDSTLPVVVQSARQTFRLTGTKFILKTSANREGLFLLDGKIEFVRGSKTEKLSAGHANVLIIDAEDMEIRQSPLVELKIMFPDLKGALRDL